MRRLTSYTGRSCAAEDQLGSGDLLSIFRLYAFIRSGCNTRKDNIVTKVDRQHGSIEDSELNGDTILTITVQGIHPTDPDLLDRTLQFVLMELGVDTTWQEAPPPPVSPPPVEPVPPGVVEPEVPSPVEQTNDGN